MNIEFEIKVILRSGGTPQSKAEQIINFTNFNELDIIEAIRIGEKDISDVYETLINLTKKRRMENENN